MRLQPPPPFGHPAATSHGQAQASGANADPKIFPLAFALWPSALGSSFENFAKSVSPKTLLFCARSSRDFGLRASQWAQEAQEAQEQAKAKAQAPETEAGFPKRTPKRDQKEAIVTIKEEE